MCRNIKTLFNFEPPATEEEIHASALQFVRKLSMRLLPERSGIRSSLGPVTWTKPGLPPRGEASTAPSEPEVASTQNGDISMNFLACASTDGRAFAITRGVGCG